MARDVRDLLAELEAALEGQDARQASSGACRHESDALADRMPLVHRTGRPDQAQPWQHILRDQVLRVSDAITDEEVACGWRRAVYFSLGSAAFPSGSVVFILDRLVVGTAPTTFSAFDSGGLARGHITPSVYESWDAADRLSCLARHSGEGADVARFGGSFLAAHFRKPSSYVSLPQHSAPDFPPYHGLVSTNGDRRAWTIELRVQGDVTIVPNNPALRAIVLANRALEAEIPDAYLGRVVVADDGPDGDGDVATATRRWILEGAP